jgi:hypothetical protein
MIDNHLPNRDEANGNLHRSNRPRSVHESGMLQAFPCSSRAETGRLKIVVSPVRVRVSPSAIAAGSYLGLRHR